MNFTLPQLLKTLVDQGGSDLHISVGSAPRLRINGNLVSLQVPPLEEEQSKQLCYAVLSEYYRAKLEEEKEIDLAFTVSGLARFRANIYTQKGYIGAAFRAIPSEVRTLESLDLPPVFQKLCLLPRGLVLITGPTGSGKSTTMAAMIDYINKNRYDHIVTIEDPIEFIHKHQNCLINQREVGPDTGSFTSALKSALRQDPDVILLGEMRDTETIKMAITAAETGHLVFGTLHTNDTSSTINRIIDVFPPHQQSQVRTQLGTSLSAVVSQQLVPSETKGRILATEVLVPNVAIKALITEGKINQIYSGMQTGQDATGMQTMNQCLIGLIRKRVITPDMALLKSTDTEELKSMLEEHGLMKRRRPTKRVG